MLDALMSQLPEDTVVIHTTELINSPDPSHSKLTEKYTCNSVPAAEGNMPLNNSYPGVPEHRSPIAEHITGTYAPSQEVDLSTSDDNKLPLGHGSEQIDQNHANGYTSGKNYSLPKQESENSFDSMVVMLDGVTTTMSSSQSSSTECLSVALSEGNLPTNYTECGINDEGQNVRVVDEQNGLVENGTKDEISFTNDTNDESCEDSADIQEGEMAAPYTIKSNSSGNTKFSLDTNATVKTTSNMSTSDKNHPTLVESLERPQKIDEVQQKLTTEHSSVTENQDSDGMEAVDISSTDGASEASKPDDDNSRTVSESTTASTLESKSPMSGTGDQLVDSILRQMDDEDGENVVLRRKEMRPNSIRLSAISLGGQGIAGCSTPVGRVSNFGAVGDEVDLDETQFVEINLQSCNSESKSTNDRSASGDSTSTSSIPSKTSRLGSFLTRNFMLKKSREKDEEDPSSDVLGWKLFGRVPPKQALQSGLTEILNEYKAKVSPRPIADKDHVVRRSDKEVPSTTALILQPRQSGLPSKDPEEEQKQKMMYEEMVEGARKSEQKEAKLKKRQREQQIRHEEELSAAVRIWNAEILPYWETAKNSKRTQDLWWKGIPPSIRGKVWRLAIGNDLNVTSELYEICLVRAREKLKILRDVAAGSDTDSLSSFSMEATGNRESSVDLIQLDVSRTFPQLCIFQAGGPYHKLLQGLLGAYVCYRPDVGYVQGMSFLAAVLLLNMDDVSSFICFANLLNKPCEVALFRLNENLMKAYFDTYQVFFKENLPKLYAHFEAQRITPDLYIIDWMYTLFAKSLPLDVASRVWDVFCRDGEEFLFRTALGILRLYEDILLHLDFIHLAQFLTRLPENISGIELFHCIAQIRMQSNKCSFAQVFARNQSQ